MTMNPSEYWVRPGHGHSFRFERIRSLTQLSIADQMISAILREDCPATERLCAMVGDCDRQRFMQRATEEKLLALLADCSVRAGSFESLQRAMQLPTSTSIIAREAAACAIASERMSVAFDAISQCKGNVLVMKGPALARTLYAQPYFRASGDLDLLVHQDSFVAVASELIAKGWAPLMVPEFCLQTGVGPVESLQDLLASPSQLLLSSSPLGLGHSNGLTVDIKLEPYERGIRPREYEEIFSTALTIGSGRASIHVPDLPFALLIATEHLAKHSFSGWRWLYDIKLLCAELTKTNRWQDFVRLCNREEAHCASLVALLHASNLVGAEPPLEILQILQSSFPQSFLTRCLAFTINPHFDWNSASLPTLLTSAACTEGRGRKQQALRDIALPSGAFLRTYYGRQAERPVWLSLLLHWLLLLLPAAAVRRSALSRIWPASKPDGPVKHFG